jgi:hypothetical protein
MASPILPLNALTINPEGNWAAKNDFTTQEFNRQDL